MFLNKTQRQQDEYKQKLNAKSKYKKIIHKIKSAGVKSLDNQRKIDFCNKKIKNIDKLLFYK
jgi:hypothetical protein